MKKISRLLARLQTETDRVIVSGFNEKKSLSGYKKIVKNEYIDVFQISEIKIPVIAAFNSVVVRYKTGNDWFIIQPNYSFPCLKYKVRFNNRIFPGVLPSSSIQNILILPYLREVQKDRMVKRWRVVVITDKCQIYHNFPSRMESIDGFEEFNDIVHFEESAVWDIPGRKYPSCDIQCDEYEDYLPYLPDTSYEYHPDVSVKSKYGNIGFNKYTYAINDNKKVKISRFYFPNRISESNPFVFMGGYESDYKMSLIGTYQSNKRYPARTCVFATSDGGRNFYAKIEFADEGEYCFKQGEDTWGCNFGNPLKTSAFQSDYNGVAKVYKRVLSHEENKLFTFSHEQNIYLKRNRDIIYFETENPHGFVNGNIVCIKGEMSDTVWASIFNNSCNEHSSGNNRFFKVKVLSDTGVELYECVSNPMSNIACRHIHHINRIRDGWIIGTGEIYPNGWLFYIQMKEADNYSRISASDDLKTIRLNSNERSVQRTLGADLIERLDNYLVIASDHDLLHRPIVLQSDDYEISRNSTGVYGGYLKNINDFNSFDILYEAKEPAYFFKKIGGRYLFSGQRGELAINTNDTLTKWSTFRLGEPLIHYRGATYMCHFIDKYAVIIKK